MVSKDKDRILLSISKDKIKLLNQISKDIGISRNDLILLAINEYLNKDLK